MLKVTPPFHPITDWKFQLQVADKVPPITLRSARHPGARRARWAGLPLLSAPRTRSPAARHRRNEIGARDRNIGGGAWHRQKGGPHPNLRTMSTEKSFSDWSLRSASSNPGRWKWWGAGTAITRMPAASADRTPTAESSTATQSRVGMPTVARQSGRRRDPVCRPSHRTRKL